MPAEQLQAQIENVRDLRSVVKTMKALAAVSIRQYQTAVESLLDYHRTVETGLQFVLQAPNWDSDRDPNLIDKASTASGDTLVAIVFGSDRGLCGQFNEKVARLADEKLTDFPEENLFIAAVGDRVSLPLQAQKRQISARFSVPNSIAGITDRVRELLVSLQNWRSEKNVRRVLLFYNRSRSGSAYEPQQFSLLPLNENWLRELQERDRPSSGLPSFYGDRAAMFSALIREHLFVSLYRAFAESLASENASRLSSMQAAEKNIRERLDDLTSQYRRQRQSAITSELLDIASGFEALTD